MKTITKSISLLLILGSSVLFVNQVQAANGENLLLNQDVTYSDVEGGKKADGSWKYPQFIGEMTVDGDYTSRWSAGKNDDQWLIVDMGELKEVSQIVIDFYAMSPNYDVMVSENGVTYTTVYEYANDSAPASTGTKEKKVIEIDTQTIQYVKYQQNKMWKHTNGQTYGSSIAEIEAYEEPLSLTEITLNSSEATLSVGRGKQLIYSVTPASFEVTSDQLTWESSNPTVAAVDENGYVRAVGVGTAEITVTFEDTDITASSTITVEESNQQYDLMLSRWQERLLGNQTDASDADIAAYIQLIDTESQELWSTLDKSASRTYLWTKKTTDTTSADFTTQFTNIKKLTLAYYKEGTALYHNQEVKAEIIKAIDFMIDTKKYNGSYWTGNWWDWQIGSAQPLTDTLILLHDDLVSEDYSKLEKFVAPLKGYAYDPGKQWPSYNASGANLTDIAITVLGTGILLQDDSRVAMVQEKVPSVLIEKTSGDGLYADGSLVQHTYFPYNGSYGNELLKGVGRIQSVLADTDWEIQDNNMSNLFVVVDKGYLDLMTTGKMPSMFSGRSISRAPGLNPFTTELESGKETMANLSLIAKFAPEDLQTKIKSYIKNWLDVVGDRFNFYASPRDFEALSDLKNIVTDETVVASESVQTLNVYASMDRVFQKTPGYAVGLSMYSTRIANYEYGNTENAKGWHTADGMLYLYNNDLNQFDEGYWATIDAYRLPGTTVDTKELVNGANTSKKSPQRWVGGVSDGTIGSVGMALNKVNEGMDLTGRKSWFLLEDRVINLGAGITGTTEASIEQIIENRLLDSTATYTQNSDENNQWVNLSQPGGNLGYVIPNSMGDIQVTKETNSGTYKDINGYFNTDTLYIKDYLKILKNYGSSASDETYEYMIIPNKSDAELTAIASDKGYEVVLNTNDAQAIATDSYLMANVWNGGQTVDYITANTPMALVVQKIAYGEYKLTLANPLQDNSAISLELGKDVTEVVSKDDAVSVSGNTISLNSSGLYGSSRTITVKVVEPYANKEELETAISSALALDANEYTTESWEAVSSALETAQSVKNYPDATQEAVDTAKNSLADAISQLVRKADKTALESAISLAEGKLKGDYTADSWANLQNALGEARNVFSNENADQLSVDNATEALNAAISSLVVNVDKSELAVLHDANVNKEQGNYTDGSWNVFKEAMKTAEAILNSGTASQESINTALTFLQTALDNLTTESSGGGTTPIEADKTELKQLTEKYTQLEQGNYTADSWATFQAVLASAQAVLSSNSSTQAVVDAMVAALSASFNNLVETVEVATTTPMYRAYNPNSHEHLFTINKAEYEARVSEGWKAEGIAWDAPTSGAAVYRLYNLSTGEHLYTVDKNEYEMNAALGWLTEGIAFYSDEEKGISVYRLYNPNELAFNHHYTTSSAERDMLAGLGWVAEGTAFYGAK